MSGARPKATPPAARSAARPLTEILLKEFRNASNRVSVESLRYAANICGYTELTTETITTLEKLIETGSANLRPLHQRAAKSTFSEEPLLDAILRALKWASSNGTGGFRVGNVVDAIYGAKLKRGEPNSDAETYARLAAIHDQIWVRSTSG
jgi:hypothetical protein